MLCAIMLGLWEGKPPIIGVVMRIGIMIHMEIILRCGLSLLAKPPQNPITFKD